METKYVRFIRYTTIGVSTFAFDLILLWIFIDLWGMHHILATILGFWAAVSINYTLSRKWVFKYSTRALATGYIYFLKFSLIGGALIVGLMYVAVDLYGAHYFPARIGVAAAVGLINYLANLYLNFKVAGEDLQKGTEVIESYEE